MNYSLISKKMITSIGEDTKNYLQLSSVLSEEIEFLRRSLLPSLLKNVSENVGRSASLQLFELAKVYLPTQKDFPEEFLRLGMGGTRSFSEIKGYIESMCADLHISEIAFQQSNDLRFDKHAQCQVFIGGKKSGVVGVVSSQILSQFNISSLCTIAELDFLPLVNHMRTLPVYVPDSSYAHIHLDATIQLPKGVFFGERVEKAKKASLFLTDISVISSFQDKITIRCTFVHPSRNLTTNEATAELDRVKSVFTHQA